MWIVKVLNNSTVIANDGELELIVMGKGISFGKRPGDKLEKNKIEKYFWLDSKKNAAKLAKLLDEIPIIYFEIVKDLVSVVQDELSISLNESIYLSLTEHIHFAVTQFKKGIMTPNALLFEIAVIYQAEYQFALRALSYIQQQLGVQLPNDEAGFIALHLIIAQSHMKSKNKVTQLTTTVHDMIQIIKTHYGIDLSESNLDYARLVIHLKFFIMRVWCKKQMPCEEESLYHSLDTHYTKAKEILPIIAQYMEDKYEYRLNEREKLYLTLHIQRLISSH